MSCCCCCCVTPSGELLEGIRKKEWLVRKEEEEEAGGGEEEESRRNMEISLLREQYRCTRDRQKRHTQVLLFRKVSEELSEAVSIIPVTQGLTSPWEPNSSSSPATTFEPDPTTYDPWHVHLGLHRRSCPRVTAQLTASSPETTNTNSSSCRSSSSSDPPREEDHLNTDWSREDPDAGPSERSREDSLSCSQMGPVQVSVSGSLEASEQNPSDGSKDDDSQECSAAGPLTSSDESSTPVTSIACSLRSSTTSLHEDLKVSNDVLQTGSTSPWRGSRKFSAPALRFTRQLSVGGVGSSTGVHQNQNYHPFPNRKTPRISEAARRLGMYSSF
ncbi:uncharacterized protein [Enoplosus armatus]|uniref:uncharacterized protein n=1 Tax=Enoplosus armatus TaxID=215367 RepID=UPI0039915D5C